LSATACGGLGLDPIASADIVFVRSTPSADRVVGRLLHSVNKPGK
jgi:hypothetical protein